MKLFVCVIILLSSWPTLAEPRPNKPIFDCDTVLRSGASFAEIKKQLKPLVSRKGVVEFNLAFRFLLEDYEIDIGLGSMEEEDTDASFAVENYDIEETLKEARENNFPQRNVFADRIWFSKDFKEMRLINSDDPAENVKITFVNPLNGKNLKPENIETVSYETNDSDLVSVSPSKKFKTEKYEAVETKYKGKQAEALYAVLQSVAEFSDPSRAESGEIAEMLSMDMVPGMDPDMDMSALNIEGADKSELMELFDLDPKKTTDEELQRKIADLKREPLKALKSLDFDKLIEVMTRKAKEEGASNEEIEEMKTMFSKLQMMLPMLGAMDGLKNLFKFGGEEADEAEEIVYREGLVVRVTEKRGKKVISAEFSPENQLEVHFILSGLRALGLPLDHPIFRYADDGYFEE